MATNYAYLVMVDGSNNHNKFYEITENADSSIDVNYGRVGGTTMHKHYESYHRNFYELRDEKLQKGYEDVTALHSEIDKSSSSANEKDSYLPIEDSQVQELMDLLITSSREFMNKNYTVKAQNITAKMIDEASNDISELNKIALSNSPDSLYFFNKKLEQLFIDVPRKMNRVDDFLASKESDFDRIIKRETDMLDNLKGIVGTRTQQVQVSQDKTVLEAHGLTARPVTYKEEDQITAHLGRDYDGRDVENRYVRAFAVENLETRKAYEDYKTNHHMKSNDVRLFYHGSKVENFYSIMKQGLLLNPNATVTGKMFGQGLYFAPECRKALNYMDVKGAHWNSGSRETGYCAIYAVALGKSYKPDHILGSNFRGSDLPAGTQSVFASKKDPRLGLRNDEYIVYDQAACTIKYLMEISKEKVRTKEYNLSRNVLRDGLESGLDTLVKTPDGFKAELMLENLSSAVRNEISVKITDNYNCDHLYLDYNKKQDKITFSIDTTSGDHIDIYPSVLTKDDYAFVTREMKKAFVSSENEWKALVQQAKGIATGKVVLSKNAVQESEQKEKNTVMSKE